MLWGNAGFADGLVSPAFSFDGANSGVLIGGTGCYGCIEGGLTNVQNNFTIEFWANPSASRPSTPEITSSLGGVDGQRYAVYPSMGGWQLAGVGVSVGTNGISVVEHGGNYMPTVLVWDAPVSGWTHVALVYENKQPRLYVNGSLVRIGLSGARALVYPSTFLGGNPGAVHYGIYQGLLDEVSIYNRPLTDAEIAAVWLAGSSGKCKLRVTTLTDSGPGSLRQAIADAAPGDTIDFGVMGTITLTNGELVITNNLTIKGPGATILTVSGNNASRVFAFDSVTATLSGLTVADGHGSGPGAGINNNGGSLTISNCAVTRNMHEYNFSQYGGGLCNSTGAVTIVSSTFCGNRSGSGGGIANLGGQMVIVSSTISSNQAFVCGSWGGGGIFNCDGSGQQGLLALTNCTISSNDASLESPGYGGGVCGLGTGASLLFDCTVASNAAAYGGGLYVSAPFRVGNSIVAGNSTTAGGPDCSGTITSDGYNLVQDPNSTVIVGDIAHNLYGLDPLLGPLADNGGPTMTHALLPGSPCIDQGSSGGLATDQRGRPRTVDFPGIANAEGGDGSDIGAFELQDIPQVGPVFTVNTTDDVDKGIPGVLHCSFREAINAANAQPGAHTINLPGLTGTITLTNGELVITNDLTINGPGATNLTVSGNNSSRVFLFNNVATLVSGLTVSNGRIGGQEDGAGIKNVGGSLTISNCTVTANAMDGIDRLGAGIRNSGGELRVINSVIINNDGGRCVGAGICSDGSLALINCAVANNSGESAAGVFVVGGSCMITNTTISGNIDGGAGWWYNSYGAGISLIGSSSLWLCNSTVVSNRSVGTWSHAGGVFATTGTMHLLNSIVVGNTGSAACPDVGVYAGNLISDDFNIIGNTNIDFAGNGATITGVTTHNIYGKDPLLGPLADNGGPTPTHALLPGSPAIDHGSSGGLATDQRGQPRLFNFPAYFDADDGSDIGAVEMQEGPQTGPVFTVNTTDDADDGVPGIAHCSLREAINAANANTDYPSTTISFATNFPGLMTGVTGRIVLTNGVLEIDRSASIVGPGAAELTISGNNSSGVFYKVWYPLAVSGLTIADGRAGGGYHSGAIENASGDLSLTDCVVSNCLGAIASYYWIGSGAGLSVTLTRCIITMNIDPQGYGCIYNEGLISFSDSSICSNTGNGVWSVAGELSNCTISGNTGDGIVHHPGATTGFELSLASCTVCSNGGVGGPQ